MAPAGFPSHAIQSQTNAEYADSTSRAPVKRRRRRCPDATTPRQALIYVFHAFLRTRPRTQPGLRPLYKNLPSPRAASTSYGATAEGRKETLVCLHIYDPFYGSFASELPRCFLFAIGSRRDYRYRYRSPQKKGSTHRNGRTTKFITQATTCAKG